MAVRIRAVDNITHSLFAVTLANVGLRRAGRGTTAALVIASKAGHVRRLAAKADGLIDPFRPGVAELVVGKNAAASYRGFTLGNTLRFGGGNQLRLQKRPDEARALGNTVGGVFEVVAHGLPIGLGSHVHWDRRLDGALASAIMSIPSVKGVELGLGFEQTRRLGSEVHDVVDGRDAAGGWIHRSNNAGGLTGGITNGEPLVVRAAMKPLPKRIFAVSSGMNMRLPVVLVLSCASSLLGPRPRGSMTPMT